MQTTRTHRIRTRLVAVALAAASVLGVGTTALVAAQPASADVMIGGVNSTATAYYDGCNHLVEVTGTPTNVTVGGNYSTYFRTAVYDGTTRQWTWSTWVYEDGIRWAVTRSYAPGSSVYVQYARVVNGAWRYAGEYVRITEELDNMWCSTAFSY